MIFDKILQQYQKQLPFVVYKKPNSSKIIVFLQEDDSNNEFLLNQSGFCFISFTSDEKYFLSENSCTILQEDFKDETHSSEYKNEIYFDENEKIKFEELVSKALNEISINSFDKVVLSRKEEIAIENFNIALAFKKMISLYKNAFCYCFFHTKTGLYFGATPEQFVKIENTSLATVALAATQLHTENIVWQQKEKNEQQIVTQFLLDSLQPFSTVINFSEPYNHRAGNLVHLKTDIKAQVQIKDIDKIIKALHPTPAVCGFPKDKAKDFILKNETYKRGFYTGFLGEWNKNFENNTMHQYDLYVNLRCMKIEEKKATLFVGCGINKDSNPEKEFLETVYKTHTMKKVLF